MKLKEIEAQAFSKALIKTSDIPLTDALVNLSSNAYLAGIEWTKARALDKYGKWDVPSFPRLFQNRTCEKCGKVQVRCLI